MMCLACEQDAMWLAYLRRKGLITEDGYLVEEPPSLFDPVEAAPTSDGDRASDQKAASQDNNDDSAGKPADNGSLSCDDPTAQ
jgi:hypothetical protein